MKRRLFLHRFGSGLAGGTALVSAGDLLLNPSSRRYDPPPMNPRTDSPSPTAQEAANRVHVRAHPNRPGYWLAPTLRLRPSDYPAVIWDMSAPFDALKNEEEQLEARIVFWTDVQYQGRRQFPPFGTLSYTQTLTSGATSISQKFAGFLNGYLKSRGRDLQLEYLAFFPEEDQFVIGSNSPPKMILEP